MKSFLNEAFVENESITFQKVNNFFALLTIASILSLVLETVPSLSEYSYIFFTIEWTAVILFIFEYTGRVYVSKPTWRYTLSFFGIIDLVAILPTVLGLGNLVFLKSARSMRIIRLLRMLRLAKISRGSFVDEESTSVLTLNILIYFSVLTFALLVTGTAMYLVEPKTAEFVSIPAGMWWSFKVFLSNIPVAQPVTAVGGFFYVVIRFIGLLLLGLLIGVVGNVFRAVMLVEDKKK